MNPLTFTRRNSLRAAISAAICILLIILLQGISYAQERPTDGSTPLGLSPGAPAGAYSLSGFESVNLYNGNLNFSLPLVKIAGRGGAAYPITLRLEQKWIVDKEPDKPQTHYYPVPSWWTLNTAPIYSMGRMDIRQAGSRDYFICGSAGYIYNYTLTRLTFTAPDGTEYELRDQATNGQPNHPSSCTALNRGKNFVTADGSSATFVSDSDISDYVYPGEPNNIPPSGYMLLSDGTRFRIDSGLVSWMRDRNGNKLTFSNDLVNRRMNSVTDSLGRQVTIIYDNGSTGYDEIRYNGLNGVVRSIKVYRTNLSNALRSDFTIQTYQQLFPELNGAEAVSFNVPVTSAVQLPNGQQYQFRYNSYGELARVVLPTGGAFEYDYAAGTTDGAASGVISIFPDKHIYRRVIERRIYPQGGSGTAYASRMTYSRPETSTTNAGYVAVDAYDSAGTLLERSYHYFYGSARASFGQQPTQYPAYKDGREYMTDVYDSNGTTVLRRMVNTFAQRAAVSWWTGDPEAAPPNDPRVVQTDSTIEPGGANLVTRETFSYDQFNNRTDVYEYAYGTGAPGALVRHGHTDYLTTNPVNGADYTSTTIYLRSLPTQQSIYDAGGTERSRTTFEYDNYAPDTYHASLVDRTGISGLDSAFTTSYGTRGNVTRVSRWLLPSATTINTYAQYDIAGNPVKAIDGRGLVSQASYSSTYQYAYPTQTTSAIPDTGNGFSSSTPLVTTTAYDFSTGLVTSSTDPNNQTTTVQYNDALERPTAVLRPDGGTTTYTYVDAHQCGPFVETRTKLDTAGRQTDDYVFFDGLGRTVRTFKYDGQDPNNLYITTDTQYDAQGRVQRVSNPYISAGCTATVNPSGNWTTTTYDALGRPKTVTTPDNAQVVTTYSGNQVTVQDQAGKTRQSTTDAQGRLTQVIEDPGSGHLNYQTNYSYDALNNLSTVTQGAQHRYFMYDALSRLVRARNPEQDANASLAVYDQISGNSQWSIGYAYDNDGNLTTRTDARGVTATYTYDNLNRNTLINYSDGTPTIWNYYDGAVNGRGRMWSNQMLGDKAMAIQFDYDVMGRVTQKKEYFNLGGGVWSPVFNVQRSYDLVGNVLSQTYPSGRTVSYAYDYTARTTSFTGNLGDGVTRNYATSIVYDQWNSLTRERFGTDIPLYHKERRNVRGQTYDVRLSTVNDAENWNRGAIVNYYSFQPVGVGTSGPDNNGNLLMQQHWVPNDDAMSGYNMMQQNYGYDALNRLNWVGEYQNGTNYTGAQGQNIDQYGNRTIGGYFGTGINGQQFAVDTNTNRLGVPAGQSGAMQYDANGNLSNDTYSGAGTRTYDAENRMITAANTGGQQSVYTYNAEGSRIRRNSYNQETWQVYGVGGELLAEYAANAAPGSPQKEYGYRNGELLVVASPSADVKWVVADQLGTPRMIADRSGSLSGVKRHDYLPFGEEMYTGTGGRTTQQGYALDGVRQQFTGYERDAETGLDYAQARYYSNIQGRFMGIDTMNASAHPGSPQTWNRYAYTLNNPLKFVDPSGMYAVSDIHEDIDPTKQNQQIINPLDDAVINKKLEEINKDAKPLAPGETPLPTNVEYIPGEQRELHNTALELPDGTKLGSVANGYLRVVAVVVTDQKGNIINDPNMTITENVAPADAMAEKLVKENRLRTSNNQEVLQADNGVFYDFQGRSMGADKISYRTTQELTIKSRGREVFKIEGIQIRTDDKTRTISIKPGKLKRD